MQNKLVMKDQNVRELMELRWRINKLEELKNGRDLKEQMLGTDDEFLHMQCFQFFLGLRLSQVAKTKDEQTIE